MEGIGGEVEPGLLRLYAFWQVKFQECVNDSCVVIIYLYTLFPSFNTLNAECEIECSTSLLCL